jgi:hypothetical protein
VRCGKYKLDGYRQSDHTALEFLGCFWHGCMHCIDYLPDRNDAHYANLNNLYR